MNGDQREIQRDLSPKWTCHAFVPTQRFT